MCYSQTQGKFPLWNRCPLSCEPSATLNISRSGKLHEMISQKHYFLYSYQIWLRGKKATASPFFSVCDKGQFKRPSLQYEKLSHSSSMAITVTCHYINIPKIVPIVTVSFPVLQAGERLIGPSRNCMIFGTVLRLSHLRTFHLQIILFKIFPLVTACFCL